MCRASEEPKLRISLEMWTKLGQRAQCDIAHRLGCGCGCGGQRAPIVTSDLKMFKRTVTVRGHCRLNVGVRVAEVAHTAHPAGFARPALHREPRPSSNEHRVGNGRATCETRDCGTCTICAGTCLATRPATHHPHLTTPIPYTKHGINHSPDGTHAVGLRHHPAGGTTQARATRRLTAHVDEMAASVLVVYQ